MKGYPIIDGHRKHYVHHPVQNKAGKWVRARVLLPSGFISVENDPTAVPFDTEAECQKGCDIHNSYHGWNKEKALAIVAKSMGIKLK